MNTIELNKQYNVTLTDFNDSELTRIFAVISNDNIDYYNLVYTITPNFILETKKEGQKLGKAIRKKLFKKYGVDTLTDKQLSLLASKISDCFVDNHYTVWFEQITESNYYDTWVNYQGYCNDDNSCYYPGGPAEFAHAPIAWGLCNNDNGYLMRIGTKHREYDSRCFVTYDSEYDTYSLTNTYGYTVQRDSQSHLILMEVLGLKHKKQDYYTAHYEDYVYINNAQIYIMGNNPSNLYHTWDFEYFSDYDYLIPELNSQTRCYNCDDRIPQNEEYYSEITNESYCGYCYHELFTHCDSCGYVVPHDDIANLSDEALSHFTRYANNICCACANDNQNIISANDIETSYLAHNYYSIYETIIIDDTWYHIDDDTIRYCKDCHEAFIPSDPTQTILCDDCLIPKSEQCIIADCHAKQTESELCYYHTHQLHYNELVVT